VNDLADVEVGDKAAVALLGAWKLDPNTPFGYDRAIGKAIEVSVRSGKLLIYVSEELAVSSEDFLSADMSFFVKCSRFLSLCA